MSSWEEIANEIVPDGSGGSGLATGARRGASLPAPRDSSAAESHFPAPPIAPRIIACPTFASNATLDQALNGQVQSVPGYGEYYEISRVPHDFDEEYDSLPHRLGALLQAETFPRLSGASLHDLLFVDIETTGLSSDGPLFLIGALGFARGSEEARLELFLARDFDEESAVIAAFLRRARGKFLVTFNGHSFDWPFIEGRSTRLGIKCPTPRGHLDLLFPSRRAWRSLLPNCRLQTLETFICGRARRDDIPSSRIPETYRRWLEQSAIKRGAHLLAPVVHHNALDVLTMAELLCFLAEKQTWRDRRSEEPVGV